MLKAKKLQGKLKNTFRIILNVSGVMEQMTVVELLFLLKKDGKKVVLFKLVILKADFFLFS